MSNSPVISFIVPVYNAQQWLDKCIESITGQTFCDIEIILINDGSTDHSGAICDEYPPKDTRIKVIHKPNGGVSSARNAGLEKAEGEYVIFVDSDDRIRPDMAEILLGYGKRFAADCIICGVTQDSGTIWRPQKNKLYNDIQEVKEELPVLIDTELLSIPFNKLFKRNLITKPFRADMGFGEDLVFSLDYLDNCNNILFITESPYLHNNLNTASIVHKYSAGRFHDIEMFQQRILAFYGNRTDNAIYAKYIRDISDHLFDLISQPALSRQQKRDEIKKWYDKSIIKDLAECPFSRVHWKKRLLIHALKHDWVMAYERLTTWKRKIKS